MTQQPPENTPHVDQSSYNDIVTEAIDELNTEQSYAGTEMKHKEKPAPRRSAMQNPAVVTLSLLLAVNVALFFYFAAAKPAALTETAAKLKVQRTVSDNVLAARVVAFAEKNAAAVSPKAQFNASLNELEADMADSGINVAALFAEGRPSSYHTGIAWSYVGADNPSDQPDQQ